MNKLKPCPFCGGKDIRFFKSWLRCEKCGCETDFYSTVAEAIEAWNTRVEVQDDLSS
jgi:Lar family restriction alleviation protein